jgi:hypothetical protein
MHSAQQPFGDSLLRKHGKPLRNHPCLRSAHSYPHKRRMSAYKGDELIMNSALVWQISAQFIIRWKWLCSTCLPSIVRQ